MSKFSFEETLAIGRRTENRIVEWLRARNNGVITVYEIQHEKGGGPRFFTKTRAYVAPDVLVFPKHQPIKTLWCETKHKTTFSWRYTKREWQTGIDIKHYRDYLEVQKETGVPVWLLFLHVCPTPRTHDLNNGCPEQCPVGLFGGDILQLRGRESHRSDRHGRSGMVYWSVDALKKMAPIDQFVGY